MKTVHHHSAAVLIAPNGTLDSVLLGMYDETYPVKVFRNHYNLIGGNPHGDMSPLDTLKRELDEELNSSSVYSAETVGKIIGSREADVKTDYQTGRVYASPDKLNELKLEILKNVGGYRDYVVEIDKDQVKTDKDLIFILSVYLSRINRGLFNDIKMELKSGKQIVNEGNAVVATPEELASGKVRGSWGYSTIVGDILGIKVPEYGFVRATSLGTVPRNSFEEYKSDFLYERNPE